MPSGLVDAEIPEGQCRKRQCENANFFHSNFPRLRQVCDELDRLEREGARLSEELVEARDEIQCALKNPQRLYDYKNCLRIGDLWMHLECVKAGIKDFGTTNYKESQHLCPILGLNMVKPEPRSSSAKAT